MKPKTKDIIYDIVEITGGTVGIALGLAKIALPVAIFGMAMVPGALMHAASKHGREELRRSFKGLNVDAMEAAAKEGRDYFRICKDPVQACKEAERRFYYADGTQKAFYEEFWKAKKETMTKEEWKQELKLGRVTEAEKREYIP